MVPADNGRDILGSTLLREIMGADGKPFLSTSGSEGRYVFTLAMDGFNPWRNKVAGKKDSVGGLYMICLNLPPAERYKPENMFLVGIIPGHPSLDEINHFLRPLVNDLLEFFNPGVSYSRTPAFPNGRWVRLAVAPLVCDLVAARQMAGYASYNTIKFFCSFCLLSQHDIENTDKSTWGERTLQEHLKRATQWRDAKTEAKREKLFKKHGIRWSELLRLPYWNPLIFTMIDLMHALLLGDFQRHVRDAMGMDVNFEDGDSLQDDPQTGPSREDIARAQVIFRSGSDAQLGALPTSHLQEVAKERALQHIRKKPKLLQILQRHVSRMSALDSALY